MTQGSLRLLGVAEEDHETDGHCGDAWQTTAGRRTQDRGRS